MRRRDRAEAQPEAWTSFPDLPGTHLSLELHGWRAFFADKTPYELVRDDGTVVARMTPWRTPRKPQRFTIDEVVFEQRWPHRHFASNMSRRDQRRINAREVVGLASNSPVFRLEGFHYNREATTVVIFPDSRRYSFPVSGRSAKYGLMTCVNELGNPILRYRCVNGRRHEIVVDPSQHLTTELTCVVMVSLWLRRSFFARPSGGA